MPLAFIILLKDIRLFRDFTLILITVALTAQVLQIGSKMRASAAMSADVINKFDPVLSAQSCPNEILLWLAFALAVAAPVVGKVLVLRRQPREVARMGALGTGLAGVGLVLLAILVGGKATWANPEFAPLLEPAQYAWIALFLVAACVLSLGAVFAPEDAPLSEQATGARRSAGRSPRSRCSRGLRCSWVSRSSRRASAASPSRFPSRPSSSSCSFSSPRAR